MAGCLFQTVWNLRSGRRPEAQIKDYDLFYFDAADLSASAETEVNERVQAGLADLGVLIEAKNQARVHIWYEAYFGFPYPALRSSREGIDRFLVSCTCVGLRPGPCPGSSGIELYAPNGLDALYQGALSANPLCNHRPLFEKKALDYKARWDWLDIQF